MLDTETPTTESMEWHGMTARSVEERFATGPHGLTDDEASIRLAEVGPNRLEEQPPTPATIVFVRQFRSPLIYILLIALGVTLVLGEHLDASVIATVLVLNAVIGYVQERRAEGAVRALMKLITPQARVIRGGQEWEIESTELVPGDVVLLEPGTRVPADIRLTTVNALQIDESLLTGESLPVTKQVDPVGADSPLGDRASMAHTGAVATAGRGAGVVVATGQDTELGSIAALMRAEEEPATPLQLRMIRFGKLIGIAVAGGALITFTSGILLGRPVDDMFLVAVALAVSAVPEGLPIAVTITLAVGVSRMARRNAVIRRLPAVETLGSTTTIGSDKTGTLTENRMTVRQVWTSDHRYAHEGVGPDGVLLEHGRAMTVDPDSALGLTLAAGILTNEAHVYRRENGDVVTAGDPTEVALLTVAMSAGLEPDEVRNAHPVFGEIPFEPVNRYSATVRLRNDEHTVFVKGAPERVIGMCTHLLTDRGAVPLDPEEAEDAARRMARRGLRVLAFAYRELPHRLSGPDALEEPTGLVLVGLLGMMDPPRAGVREAIADCRAAGIRVLMITGDHADTARAIAADLGIGSRAGGVLTGSDLQHLGDTELRDLIHEIDVFARVSPEDKLRLVNTLQTLGEVVAVTGDGVNDAPALRSAQIGIAMGRDGTDVAREAADMVLVDDNFVSITAAVEEGRVTFDNIRKVTFFLVSTGAAEMAAIIVSVWLQWPLLLLPAQLLWLNLVTNGLEDVALAFEPADGNVLERRPRDPREGVLSTMIWARTAIAGLVMAAGTLLMFRWSLDTTGSLGQAQTVALTTLVLFQVFQAGNARSERRSVFQVNPLSNPFLFLGTGAALALHVAALYLPPTQYVLRIEPIDLGTWIRIVGVAASILVAMEAHKAVQRRRDRISA